MYLLIYQYFIQNIGRIPTSLIQLLKTNLKTRLLDNLILKIVVNKKNTVDKNGKIIKNLDKS